MAHPRPVRPSYKRLGGRWASSGAPLPKSTGAGPATSPAASASCAGRRTPPINAPTGLASVAATGPGAANAPCLPAPTTSGHDPGRGPSGASWQTSTIDALVPLAPPLPGIALTPSQPRQGVPHHNPGGCQSDTGVCPWPSIPHLWCAPTLESWPAPVTGTPSTGRPGGGGLPGWWPGRWPVICAGKLIAGPFDLDHVRGGGGALHPAHPKCNRVEGGEWKGKRRLAWGSSR